MLITNHPTQTRFVCLAALRLLLPGCLLLLVACAGAPSTVSPVSSQGQSTAESIDELILAATQSSGNSADRLMLEAIGAMLDAGQYDRGEIELDRLTLEGVSMTLQPRTRLLRAELLLARNLPAEALELLQALDRDSLDTDSIRDYYLLRATVYEELSRPDAALQSYLTLADAQPSALDQALTNRIWNLLERSNDITLDAIGRNADSYELRGWIELARVTRAQQFSIRNQLDALTQWRRVWSRHPAAVTLPYALDNLEQAWEQRPQHIALILPLQEVAGKAIQEGFLSAYYQALESSRDVPRISVFDSSNQNLIFPLYDEAVASGAELIIGPLNKALVNQLKQMPELPVPTLALNYADDMQQPTVGLYQFGLAPEDEIQQAIDLAWDAGHRNAAILTPASEDYDRLQSFFSAAWEARGGSLVSRVSYAGDGDYANVVKRLMAIDSSEARRDRLVSILPRSNVEFTPRRRQDIDFIFLIANPRQGRQIKPTLAFYFAEDVPVFALPSINDGLNNRAANRDLDGIIFTDAPWVFDETSELKTNTLSTLRQTQGALQRLRAMGIDSFALYARLPQLASGDISALRGTTGVLTMRDSQRIHRLLQVARFTDGQAELLQGNVQVRN